MNLDDFPRHTFFLMAPCPNTVGGKDIAQYAVEKCWFCLEELLFMFKTVNCWSEWAGFSSLHRVTHTDSDGAMTPSSWKKRTQLLTQLFMLWCLGSILGSWLTSYSFLKFPDHIFNEGKTSIFKIWSEGRPVSASVGHLRAFPRHPKHGAVQRWVQLLNELQALVGV